MAGTLGQIVYNIDNIKDSKNEEIKNMLINGIVQTPENKNGKLPEQSIITKLGIQAEPGTKIILTLSGSNNTISIIIGRTGIYELDEKVTISQLKIEPTYKYELNEDKTREAQNLAATKFLNIIETNNNITDVGFDNEEGWIGEEEAAITTWVNRYQTNDQLFQEGYIEYLKGKNGIYDIAKDGNNKPIIEEMHNIIIDYVYTYGSEGV